jgi:hypothetical protein
MSEVLAPAGFAPTTTPRETYVEVEYTSTEGVLVYRPEDNSFIALYPDEWLLCREEADANKTAIAELQEANRVVTEKSSALHDLLQQPNPAKAELAQARKELDTALNTLSEKSAAAKKRIAAIADQKTDPKKLVELLPLTMKRMEGRKRTPIYVSAEKLKSALADRRVYLVDGAAERKKEPKQKLFNGSQLNADEVRRRIKEKVQDKAKFQKKWKWAPKDADQFSVIFTDWAKVMGADATAFLDGLVGVHEENNPYRMIDVKPEAQFLRWAGGAGIEANFMPFQGSLYDKRDKDWKQRFKRAAKASQFSIKANAEVSFAVGEAKIEANLYLPHAAGWHLDTTSDGRSFDFGYFRFRGDLTLFALAGASIAIEADAALMIAGDKQGLKGTPASERGAKAKVGAKGEAKVFAGLKEGVSLAGALQWLNPEGFTGGGVPKKVDASKAIAAYVDVASVSAEGTLIQGLAAALGFECDYRNGNFVIAAKAGACLGLGGSGSVACKVGAEQIGQFFLCIAHQLKQADFKKIVGLMSKGAFFTLNQIYYLMALQSRTLESFVGWSTKSIKDQYEEVVWSMKQNGSQTLRKIEAQLRAGWGWYAYMPPESRGAIIKSIADIVNDNRYSADQELRTLAAFSINELLATAQSTGHLRNTLERVTVALGEAPGVNSGTSLIDKVVAGTRFTGCVDRCEVQLAQASPLLGRPYLRNDEPDFQLAQFPLHHPAYTVA